MDHGHVDGMEDVFDELLDDFCGHVVADELLVIGFKSDFFHLLEDIGLGGAEELQHLLDVSVSLPGKLLLIKNGALVTLITRILLNERLDTFNDVAIEHTANLCRIPLLIW